MRRFFFLPEEITWGLVALFVTTFFRFPIEGKLLIYLVCFIVGYARRRKKIPFRDTLKIDGEIYLSPVFGTVKSIRHNVSTLDYPSPCHEIRIMMSVWDVKGLYLPTNGEVTYLKANKGRKVSRQSDAHSFYGNVEELAHTDLTLTSKNQTKTLMRFIDCPYGARPTIWLKSGDKGRGAACFGYYPFGGTLIIYLPHESDVLIYENEKVVPGQSVIAALKDIK